MKISNDTIENRSRDLPACSAVPQSTAQPCNPQPRSTIPKNTFPLMYICSLPLQSPQPLDNWKGVLDAKQPGPMCLQRNVNTDEQQTSGQENCLFINVYTPYVSVTSSYIRSVLLNLRDPTFPQRWSWGFGSSSWAVKLTSRVFDFRRFEGRYNPHLQRLRTLQTLLDESGTFIRNVENH
jgi:hypothetical protein